MGEKGRGRELLFPDSFPHAYLPSTVSTMVEVGLGSKPAVGNTIQGSHMVTGSQLYEPFPWPPRFCIITAGIKNWSWELNSGTPVQILCSLQASEGQAKHLFMDWCYNSTSMNFLKCTHSFKSSICYIQNVFVSPTSPRSLAILQPHLKFPTTLLGIIFVRSNFDNNL